MSNRPTEVIIAGYAFEIRYLNHRKFRDDTLTGWSHWENKLIKIRTQLPDGKMLDEQSIAETVLHEIIHMTWRAYGITGLPLGDDEEENEENIVVRQAIGLHDVLRSNPGLSTYLSG